MNRIQRKFFRQWACVSYDLLRTWESDKAYSILAPLLLTSLGQRTSMLAFACPASILTNDRTAYDTPLSPLLPSAFLYHCPSPPSYSKALPYSPSSFLTFLHSLSSMFILPPPSLSPSDEEAAAMQHHNSQPRPGCSRLLWLLPVAAVLWLPLACHCLLRLLQVAAVFWLPVGCHGLLWLLPVIPVFWLPLGCHCLLRLLSFVAITFLSSRQTLLLRVRCIPLFRK